MKDEQKVELKRRINKQLAKIGLVLDGATPKSEVVSFINKLKPVQTDKDLIRIGPKGDGGYLVPNDLEGIAACFSPGVNTISGFEFDCINYGMQVYMADKTVEKPNLNLPEDKYSFIKKHIGPYTSADFITMDNWVKQANIDEKEDLLLQMDIEGAEYHSFINMSEALLSRFRIIVLEIHTLEKLWILPFFSNAQTMIDKILQTHTCVHIHPNNYLGIDSRLGVEIPKVAEFTFLRNDRIKSKKPQTSFPHPLDSDNVGNEKIVLPKNWY